MLHLCHFIKKAKMFLLHTVVFNFRLFYGISKCWPICLKIRLHLWTSGCCQNSAVHLEGEKKPNPTNHLLFHIYRGLLLSHCFILPRAYCVTRSGATAAGIIQLHALRTWPRKHWHHTSQTVQYQLHQWREGWWCSQLLAWGRTHLLPRRLKDSWQNFKGL